SRGDALDPAFRQSCAGTYQHGPIKHIVALDADGQLTLSPTDQPTYLLVPHQDRSFTIRELKGFRVKLQHDGRVPCRRSSFTSRTARFWRNASRFDPRDPATALMCTRPGSSQTRPDFGAAPASRPPPWDIGEQFGADAVPRGILRTICVHRRA